MCEHGTETIVAKEDEHYIRLGRAVDRQGRIPGHPPGGSMAGGWNMCLDAIYREAGVTPSGEPCRRCHGRGTWYPPDDSFHECYCTCEKGRQMADAGYAKATKRSP